MTTQQQLASSFRRLATRLAEVDETDPRRADGVRTRLAAHVDQLTDGLTGRTEQCPDHPGNLAHNCGPCRSEQIGAY